MSPFAFAPFFYLRPGFPAPLSDRRFVPFLCARGRPLATPAQFAQDAPHVAGMVSHPAKLINHPGNPWQRPQLCGVSKRRWPAHQGPLHLLQVTCCQTRQAPGPAHCLQSAFTVFLPLVMPTVRALTRNFQLPRHLRPARAPRPSLKMARCGTPPCLRKQRRHGQNQSDRAVQTCPTDRSYP